MINCNGIVKKVICKSQKCAIYNIEINTVVEGKNKKCWLNYVVFNPTIIYDEGTEIIVNGYLHTNSYEKDGKKVYSTEIVAL